MRNEIKFIMLFIITFILIIVSINLLTPQNKDNIENNISTIENGNTIDNYIENNENQNIIIEELNRITYKEGFYYEEIGNEIKEKITGISFPSEFDNQYKSINYEDLKYINIKHYDFNGNIKTGEIIVHKEVAEETVKIFYELYEAEYKINKMVLIDAYNGDDELSMSDNNTTCFNYRVVKNSKTLSWHAFGLAIDINPLNNPYIKGNTISPQNAGDYINRKLQLPEMIDYNDLAYKTFTKYGWKWGGNYKSLKDYQHFYKEGILNKSILKKVT